MTAEFLRRRELFSGVFLGATNHVGQIASALMRRYTFRLTFKTLKWDQRTNLLKEMLALPSTANLPPAAARMLDRLDGFSPGDFANVKMRFTLICVVPTADDWLDELR